MMNIDPSKKLNTLVVIYGPYQNDLHHKGHEIIALFGPYGLVDEGTLEEFYKEIYHSAPESLESGRVGFFGDVETIQRFSFSLCQKYNNEGVSLVTVDDYNEILTSSFKSDELVQKLQESGNFIANPDAGKSGFFSKLFN